jgi:polysaccharide export outer membrane protein
MKNKTIFAFAFLMLCALAASGQDQASGTQPQADPVGQPKAALKLGPGDLIHITVVSMPELEQRVRVSDAGTAVVSLIGELKVAGMTADDLSREIAKRLRDGDFVKRPSVTVLVEEYTTQGVAVVGEVARPGVVPVYSSRSLLDILSAVGGLKDTASTEILIRRQGQPGSAEKVQLGRDGKSLLGTAVEVGPGDQVVVPLAGIVYLLGDLNRPGGYVMSENGKITLLQAVAMAGGPTRTAAENGARLLRTTATGYEEKPVPLKDIMRGKRPDFELQPHDIVYVPFSQLKNTLLGTQAMLGAATSATIIR